MGRLQKFFTGFAALPRRARFFLSRLGEQKKTVQRLVEQVDFLYQLALMERMHPSLVKNILRLPPPFENYLSSADAGAVERTLNAALTLHRGKTDVLLDMAKAGTLLPLEERLALYQAALEQADPHSREMAAWALTRQLYKHGLDDTRLLKLLEELSLWEGGPHTLLLRRKMRIMRIALLTMRQETEEALLCLEKYLSLHGPGLLHIFPPAAWLAHNRGIRGGLLRQAALIHENIRQNREDDSFRKYLADKSIALVGNGPQELGRNRGREIDAHDVVIRFNFAVTEKHIPDYGQKTTVWARNGVRPFRYDAFPQARFLLLPNNGERYPANREQVVALAATIKRGRQIIAPSRREMQILMGELGLRSCSLGLVVAALLRGIRPDLSPAAFYGMSFVCGSGDSWAEGERLHYCDELPADPGAYAEHSLPLERAAFRRLFGGNS